LFNTHCYKHFTGTDSGTAAVIFEKMNQVFETNGIPWENCIAASVDNTSVNIGRRNSILTRVVDKSPDVFFLGCPCHIVHNICVKASEKFCEVRVYEYNA